MFFFVLIYFLLYCCIVSTFMVNKDEYVKLVSSVVNVKYCTQIGYIKCWRCDDKLSHNGRGTGQCQGLLPIFF